MAPVLSISDRPPFFHNGFKDHLGRKDHEQGKLHYVFDTGSGGIMTRARFLSKKGSFEPSCEVNRNMLKSGIMISASATSTGSMVSAVQRSYSHL